MKGFNFKYTVDKRMGKDIDMPVYDIWNAVFDYQQGIIILLLLLLLLVIIVPLPIFTPSSLLTTTFNK
jgi:hypothetical protein